MDTVGLERSLADRYPSQLSGGQQQRVGVARGLAVDPNILLMDEPFGAVDPIVRDELQNELLDLQRELDKTVVFVTHDIDEAFLLGDQVVIFRKGGIVAQKGTPAEILADPADDFVRIASSARTAASALCTWNRPRRATCSSTAKDAPPECSPARPREQRPRRFPSWVLRRRVRKRRELAVVEPRPRLGSHDRSRAIERLPDRHRVRALAADRLGREPVSPLSRGSLLTIGGILYADPVAAAVRRDAGAHRHEDPRPAQRRDRAEHLRRGAAWSARAPTRSRRAGRRRAVGDGHRILGLAAVLDGRAPARGPGAARRAPGRLG